MKPVLARKVEAGQARSCPVAVFECWHLIAARPVQCTARRYAVLFSGPQISDLCLHCHVNHDMATVGARHGDGFVSNGGRGRANYGKQTDERCTTHGNEMLQSTRCLPVTADHDSAGSHRRGNAAGDARHPAEARLRRLVYELQEVPQLPFLPSSLSCSSPPSSSLVCICNPRYFSKKGPCLASCFYKPTFPMQQIIGWDETTAHPCVPPGLLGGQSSGYLRSLIN